MAGSLRGSEAIAMGLTRGAGLSADRPVAVIFERFGPYHHARLRAAADVMEVVGIEVFAQDDTYGWDRQPAAMAFRQVTLFLDSQSVAHGSVEVATRLGQELERIRPRAVAVPGWSADYALAALGWSLELGVPTVVLSDSTRDDAKRLWWKERIKRRLVALFNGAFVAGARHAAYLRDLGMDGSRIFAGFDVVDNAYFQQGADLARTEAAALRLAGSLPDRYFLASGRFVEKKNLFRLLEAFALYRRQAGKAAWDLVLLGDGALRGALRERISSLGLSEAVTLPGFKQYEDLPVYYGLAGAFVHASTVEQWGLVVNEAMAAGLPVIVSDRCGCAPDLVDPGRNGFVFDPNDVDGLARLMGHVASADCDRRAMGRASREIIARWNPQTFAEALVQAVKVAAAAPAVRAGRFDRALIRTLMRR